MKIAFPSIGIIFPRVRNRGVSRRFVFCRKSVLWNEQRQIGITILEEGLDFLFPFSLEQKQEKTQPEGFFLSKSLALTFRAVLSRCPPCKSISAIFSLSLSLSLSSSLKLYPCQRAFISPFPSQTSRFIRWFSSTKISILFGRGIDTSSSSSRYSQQPVPLSLVIFAHTLTTSLAAPFGRETFVNPYESKRENGRCLYRSVRTNRVQARRKFPVTSAGNSRNSQNESLPFHQFVVSFLPIFLFFLHFLTRILYLASSRVQTWYHDRSQICVTRNGRSLAKDGRTKNLAVVALFLGPKEDFSSLWIY